MPTASLKCRRFAPFIFFLITLQALALFNHQSLQATAASDSKRAAASRGSENLSTPKLLSRPSYHPKLPTISHSPKGSSQNLTAQYSQDFRHYFYFVDETSSKVPPASLMDVPAKPWSQAEKADIVAIFKAIMKHSPGLIINASSDTKIALYRTKKLNSAVATANPGILIFQDKFFFGSNQYHMFSHELIHLCDLSSLLSKSKEWRSILEPAVTRAQRENQPSQEEITEYGCTAALKWRLYKLKSQTIRNKYKLQSGHACINLDEALAENCARYLTTGTVLTGGENFRRLVARDILNPNLSAITFRKHYTKATMAAVKLDLDNYDKAMQLALAALPSDKREAILPLHNDRRLQIAHSLARKSIDRKEIDALIAEQKYSPALEKINSIINRYESSQLALPSQEVANLLFETSQYYEILNRYKDSALAYEKGTQLVTASSNTFTTVTGTIEKPYLEQLDKKINRNPHEAANYETRGNALWQLAEMEKTPIKKKMLEDRAFADFNRSLALAEQSQEKNFTTEQLWEYCASYQLRRGNWPAAIACCQKAEEAGGTRHDALLIKIEALEKMKDYKAARLALGHFLEYCDQRKDKTQGTN